MNDDNEKFIQAAIEEEGRTRRYLRYKYGNKAFFNDGTIKMKYLDKAQKHVRNTPRANQEGLLDALELAERLKRMSQEKYEEE